MKFPHGVRACQCLKFVRQFVCDCGIVRRKVFRFSRRGKKMKVLNQAYRRENPFTTSAAHCLIVFETENVFQENRKAVKRRVIRHKCD